jgi:SAM-dependent methyltransferase
MQLQMRESIGKRFAEFHRLYVRDFTRDLALYSELAAKQGGTVLEVGCATGRVIRRIASLGHSCLGIDTRREMLEVARRELEGLEDRARVADHDLRSRPLPERFDLALVTLFYFNGLIEVEEQRRFLRHLLRALESDGMLAIDFYTPLAVARPDELEISKEIRRTCEGQELFVRDRREMLTPLLERRVQQFKIEPGPEGEMVTHRRYLPPPYAASLIEEAGFEEVRWVQDYDLSTAGPLTRETRPEGPFVLLARRSG